MLQARKKRTAANRAAEKKKAEREARENASQPVS